MRAWLVFAWCLGLAVRAAPGSSPDPAHVSPRVKVLEEASISRMLRASRAVDLASDGRMEFAQPNAQLRSIRPGHILACGISDHTPDGALRYVEAVRWDGPKLVVMTRQALLEEAFTQGRLSFSGRFTTEDLVGSRVALPAGARLVEKAPAGRLNGRAGKTLDWDQSIGSSVKVGLSLEFDVDYAFEVDISPRFGWPPAEVDRILVSFGASQRARITAAVSASWSDKHSWSLPPLNLPNITFYPYGVPVVLKPTIGLKVSVEGQVEAWVTTGVVQSFSANLGAEYRNGSGWRPLKSLDGNFDYQPPVARARANFRAAARPSLALKLYGIAGPHLDVELYGRLSREFDSRVGLWPWDMRAGLRIIVGVQIDIDIKILNIRYDEEFVVYQREWSLASGRDEVAAPDPPPPSPTGGPTFTGGGGVLVSGPGTGDTGSPPAVDEGSPAGGAAYDYSPALAAIDEPRPDESINGPKACTGWAVDPQSGVRRVFVLLDGIPLSDVQYPTPRDDGNLGFNVIWNATEASPGRHTLTLKVVNGAGRETLLNRFVNIGGAITNVVSESATAAADGQVGFWRHGTPHYWRDANVGDGGHALWVRNLSNGIDNIGVWRPDLPQGGHYEVLVHIPSSYATTHTARYEVFHADGRNDVVVNQSAYFDEWVSLGTFRFNGGTGSMLRLADLTAEATNSVYIGFDTARWELRGGGNPPYVDYFWIDREYANGGAVHCSYGCDDQQGAGTIDYSSVGWYDPYQNARETAVGPESSDGAGEFDFSVDELWDGAYQMYIKVRDADGHLTQQDGPVLRVDRGSPSLIRLQASPQYNPTSTTIKAAAADPSGIAELRVGIKTPPDYSTINYLSTYSNIDSAEYLFDAGAGVDARYQLALYAKDRAGNEVVFEPNEATFYRDAEAPHLVEGYFSTRFVALGDPARLYYTFSNSGLASASLYLFSPAYHSGETLVTQPKGVVDISTAGLQPGHYELYAWGTDATGNRPSAPEPTGLAVDVGLGVWLPAGLHNIGLPIVPSSGNPAQVLGPGAWEVYRYDPALDGFDPFRGGSDVGHDFQPGRGLWVWLSRATEVNLAGTGIGDTTVNLPLARGWNNLANPYGMSLPWSPRDMQVLVNSQLVGTLDQPAAQSLVMPYAWIFDSPRRQHQLVADQTLPFAHHQIPVMAGFWLKALADNVTVRLSPPSRRQSRAIPTPPSARSWSTTILAQAGDLHATALMGVVPDESRTLEIAEPPSPLGQAPLQLQVIGLDQQPLSGAIRAWREGGLTWDLLLRSDAPREVTLSWPSLLRDLPRGVILELEDLATDQTTVLNNRASRMLDLPAGERRFRLTARLGNLQRSTITSLTTNGNRSRGVALAMTLTGPAEVHVLISGLGGRTVRALQLNAGVGTSTLTWDGRDETGRAVPRGTYRVEAVALSPTGAVHRVIRTVLIQ